MLVQVPSLFVGMKQFQQTLSLLNLTPWVAVNLTSSTRERIWISFYERCSEPFRKAGLQPILHLGRPWNHFSLNTTHTSFSSIFSIYLCYVVHVAAQTHLKRKAISNRAPGAFTSVVCLD